MDASGFDRLLRRVVQTTTRREALATLLGGVLVLGQLDESEATDKAKRRRKRKRREFRQHKQDADNLKLISLLVQNPGPNAVEVHFVNLADRLINWECTAVRRTSIPPGGQQQFLTRRYEPRCSNGLVWLNTTYSIEFWNLVFRTPAVSAAVNGVSMNNRKHCPNRGTRALERTAIDEGMTFKFKIYDKEFTVERRFDTAYKEFTLTLPTNL